VRAQLHVRPEAQHALGHLDGAQPKSNVQTNERTGLRNRKKFEMLGFFRDIDVKRYGRSSTKSDVRETDKAIQNKYKRGTM
jgi:hypothetical protein